MPPHGSHASPSTPFGLAPLFLGETPAVIFIPRKLQGFDLADALSGMSRGIFEYSKRVRMEAQKAMPPVEETPDTEDSGPEIVG